MVPEVSRQVVVNLQLTISLNVAVIDSFIRRNTPYNKGNGDRR